MAMKRIAAMLLTSVLLLSCVGCAQDGRKEPGAEKADLGLTAEVKPATDFTAKANAAVYDELGIDLPTAIRMFLKRSVVVNGVPFSMTLPKQEAYRADRAIRAMQSLSEAAQQNGTADMSLDEINAEIAASRADRASRNARNGA